MRPIDGPFALTLKQSNFERIHCLNPAAEALGLRRGMPLADARAFCPDLISHPALPDLDRRFLAALRRWATRYCPLVAQDGSDGLVLDVTGATHLWPSEAAMLADMQMRTARAGLALRAAMGSTRSAAWARAHYGTQTTPLAELPVAALQLDPDTVTALQRLGLRHIGDLEAAPPAPLARRFGPGLLRRLDQALGRIAEPVSPEPELPHYGLRLSLPEPISLTRDVMAAVGRLLVPLCAKLERHDAGARRLMLTLCRVDQSAAEVELRLAAPRRDPARILPLFERRVGEVEANFGIDLVRLEATRVEPLSPHQIGIMPAEANIERLADLITRIGARIGLENIQRFQPASSHIPERSFRMAPAAYTRPEPGWRSPRPRPIRLFPPEPVAAAGPCPPSRFHWRQMVMTTAHATGPERITPEWWLSDENWRSGIRDYWKISTREGRRLWLFYTPQKPGWFVQGEFA